jgi:hypothetical protein
VPFSQSNAQAYIIAAGALARNLGNEDDLEIVCQDEAFSRARSALPSPSTAHVTG